MDGAHIEWNKIAEMTTLIIQGKTPDQADEIIARGWKRGSTPSFIVQDKLRPLDSLGTPTQHRQRELTRLKNQLADLRAKTRKAPSSWTQPFSVRPSEPQGSDGGTEKAAWKEKTRPN